MDAVQVVLTHMELVAQTAIRSTAESSWQRLGTRKVVGGTSKEGWVQYRAP